MSIDGRWGIFQEAAGQRIYEFFSMKIFMLLDWIVFTMALLVILNLLLLFFAAYKKLELAESYFSCTRLVSDLKGISGGGYVLKIYKLSNMSLVFTMTKMLQRRGLVDVGEVNSVPRGLKLWIVVPMLGTCVVSVLLIGLYLLLKLGYNF